MGTLTKHDIVVKLNNEIGMGRKEAAQLVELVFKVIKDTLARGEKIKISGFGNFSISDKSPRRGRNPKTGEDLDIPAKRVLTFRPSQVIRDDLALKYGHRLNAQGEEDKSIPVREGSNHALSSFHEGNNEESSHDSDDN